MDKGAAKAERGTPAPRGVIFTVTLSSIKGYAIAETHAMLCIS